MKWHKLMFVLPNAFTVSSIFCGFYAIILCANTTPTPQQLYWAALSIFFAIFFDGFDGRVARLTKTQSDFGVELDSLADVISFGVAPALLVYKWALAPLGFVGLFIAFSFATCGALRLARFNVLAQRKVPGSSKFFVGLPIPLAAGVLISMVIAYHHAGYTTVQANIPIAVLVAALALLMVSTVRYRTFKDARPSKKSAMVLGLVILAGVGVATQMKPSFVLVAYFSAYLLMGLAESVIFFKKRRAEAAAQAVAATGTGAAAAAVVDEDDDEDDEDFA